jgi:hypothetical protein
MSTHPHLPPTVAASLEARLAPFHAAPNRAEHLMPVDQPEFDFASQSPASPRHHWSSRVFTNIKLLIASLGAGNAVVPMGDNGRAMRELASQVALVEAARRWH